MRSASVAVIFASLVIVGLAEITYMAQKLRQKRQRRALPSRHCAVVGLPGLLLTANRPGGLAKGNAGRLDTTVGACTI